MKGITIKAAAELGQRAADRPGNPFFGGYDHPERKLHNAWSSAYCRAMQMQRIAAGTKEASTADVRDRMETIAAAEDSYAEKEEAFAVEYGSGTARLNAIIHRRAAAIIRRNLDCEAL